MADKSYLFDTTKCTACRACQVACKQWNELAAEDPVPTNRGTYENPPDLSATQWLLIHFKEHESDGELTWNFVRNSCRHCMDAPCGQAATNADAITVDADTGAVLFGEATSAESYGKIRMACPFGIPRKGADGRLYKCTMCVDRVQDGKLPACVQACPTGAMQFGDRADMLAAADARVAALQTDFPQARILDRRDVRLLILLADGASAYKLTVA